MGLQQEWLMLGDETAGGAGCRLSRNGVVLPGWGSCECYMHRAFQGRGSCSTILSVDRQLLLEI